MVNVIGVRFSDAGKMYYFSVGEDRPEEDAFVLVETSRGKELGRVVMTAQEMDDDDLTEPLKPIIRVADNSDLLRRQENQDLEREAFSICQSKIEEHRLEMKLVNVEYAFDHSKILFFFTANGRVDFRNLVKDLAGIFRTRIELRQIGVRDEARLLGGLGSCGRPICCKTFLSDFQPVSIKMAKEQKLSLNPTKISGMCGRLMCCLKYEEDQYEEIHRMMPRVGREIDTPDGRGVVLEQNVLRETVRVRMTGSESGEFRDYPLEVLLPEQCSNRYSADMEEETVPASEDELLDLAEDQMMEPDESHEPWDDRSESRGKRKKDKPPRRKGKDKNKNRENNKAQRRDARMLSDAGEKNSSEEHDTIRTVSAASDIPTAVSDSPRKQNNWKEQLEKAMERAAESSGHE